MTESKSLEIIKHAILLERRGRAFYRKVSEQTEDSAVREFFEMMAGEENKHISVLSEQYNLLQKEGHFSSAFSDISDTGATITEALSNEIKEKISAASYESAAISAAIGFEENAVKLYSSRADETEDPEEKKIYTWLANWERQHSKMLVEIDKALVETIWMDNKFWPF
ncbi:MAG: ferritin family protein [Deltaproteobacteria bacterium]|nr:ferritin family protein [Deltaproteobacteria bacterium]MBT8357449.1 ferritin family protein [Deltaproteobacteria bacterium]NNL42773.1 ferritin family protein [Desulfobacterales bacterium]